MCFSIPYRIIKVEKNIAFLEGGKSVKIGKEMKVEKGDYLQIVGNVAVEKLSKIQGQKIQRLIKSLNN